MFVLEYNKQGQPAGTLTIFSSNFPVLRLGKSRLADIEMEGFSLPGDILLCQELGSKFSCYYVEAKDESNSRVVPNFLDGSYESETLIHENDFSVYIASLPADLNLECFQHEPEKNLGFKILDAALNQKASNFPALAILGNKRMIVSFDANRPLTVGQAETCGLKLQGLAEKHLQVDYRNGSIYIKQLSPEAKIEVKGDEVTKEILCPPEEQIILNKSIKILPLLNKKDFDALLELEKRSIRPALEKLTYPCLVSNSQFIQPNYFILPSNGKSVIIGRDLTNDICIHAAHISRQHAEIKINAQGNLEIKDLSKNGVYYNKQRLPQDEVIELVPGNNIKLDFNNDLVVEILFKENKKNNILNESIDDTAHLEQADEPNSSTEIFFVKDVEPPDNTSVFEEEVLELNHLPQNVEDNETKVVSNIDYGKRKTSDISVFEEISINQPSPDKNYSRFVFGIVLAILVLLFVLLAQYMFS
ncbi:MAG: FHA domain-containing protein [Deltaproteobacteria bacterium]|jgi:hypothetical protein|nr:FHA domain-containing protein [Deltaproteobacteria bacterium]